MRRPRSGVQYSTLQPPRGFTSERELPSDALFIPRHGVAEIRRAVCSDVFARRVADSVISNADLVLTLPPLTLEFETGRDVILPTARSLYDRAAVLGMASILTGNNAYRRRGIIELEKAAELVSWNPPHFLDVAEMACGFAIGLNWSSPAMSNSEREALEDALVEKALLPGVDQLRAAAFWTTASHNWNIVCCSGLIIAGLVVGQRHAQLAQEVVSRAVDAIAHGFSSFDLDGGYAEGPGYWEYAARYAVVAIAAANHRNIPMPDFAGLSSSWLFNRETTAPSGACFNFGDTVSHPTRSPVLGWLANRSNEPEATIWQRIAPGNLHPFDLVWLSKERTSQPPSEQRVTAFNEAGICILRKSIGGVETYIGFKGGRNDVNHAHLDLGSFVLEVGKNRFVSELGRDDYALPGYFDPGTRFNYFRLGTFGHGTLLFNGQSQAPEAFARCLGTCDPANFVAAAFEIEDDKSPAHHRRGIAIADDNVWIIDEINRKRETLEPMRIEWRIFTQAQITARQKSATLCIGEQILTVEIVGCDDSLAWIVEPVASPQGEADNSAFTCLRFQTELKEAAHRLCVGISRQAAGGNMTGQMPPDIQKWPLTLHSDAR